MLLVDANANTITTVPGIPPEANDLVIRAMDGSGERVLIVSESLGSFWGVLN